MTEAVALEWARATGPEGLDLLRRYLGGDQTAAPGMPAIIKAAEAGQYGADYAGNPDPERILVTTSCHLMVMALLNRLNGLSAAHDSKLRADYCLYIVSGALSSQPKIEMLRNPFQRVEDGHHSRCRASDRGFFARMLHLDPRRGGTT